MKQQHVRRTSNNSNQLRKANDKNERKKKQQARKTANIAAIKTNCIITKASKLEGKPESNPYKKITKVRNTK